MSRCTARRCATSGLAVRSIASRRILRGRTKFLRHPIFAADSARALGSGKFPLATAIKLACFAAPMTNKNDFASLMEESLAAGTSRAKRRLKSGEIVEGTVIQITGDSVFVDVGTPGDGRIPRAELMDDTGQLRVKLGDRVSAVVLDARNEAPLLTASLGRGNTDFAALETARENGIPVQGQITQVIKGGLEVELGSGRAFCPASQVDIAHVPDLGVFVGQTLEFRVLEIRDRGRSIVVSRRALLEQQRRERELGMVERLKPGADFEGTVSAVQRHGALVDLEGVQGFVHISELAPHRIDRVEDAVNVGDRVKARVLAVEHSPKGLRVKLSLKAAQGGAPATAGPAPEEILKGTVTRVTNFGVFLQTAKGEGLVPVRELGLAPGADHRRAFPPGREIEVVLLSRDASSGKLRFSMVSVAGVQERANYREFSAAGGGADAPRSLGSLGDLLRGKLKVPEGAVADTSARPETRSSSGSADAPRRAEPSGPPHPSGAVRRRR
jgi:small subunit ribosomal protein S1